ncbi:phosphoribosyltransferase [Streptomyces sp. SRF1]|uniref:phosphoribosyltransferase n=1 Tax=Streptomyces sp. SRF1 TaxID=1549642 RepID=UPI0025B0F8AC|nr:phosphoribosyltransferase [Streptomyces sp. SRF1]MDN3061120.1 phosphoribosyltransferase [Streptomyces sp. SRF1]
MTETRRGGVSVGNVWSGQWVADRLGVRLEGGQGGFGGGGDRGGRGDSDGWDGDGSDRDGWDGDGPGQDGDGVVRGEDTDVRGHGGDGRGHGGEARGGEERGGEGRGRRRGGQGREGGGAELRELLGLALRRNPKRAHLLVSNVLGKHVPQRPATVYDAGVRLGRRVRELLGDEAAARAVVLGYAETATGLGHSVADGLALAPYLHSTRRPVPGVATVGGFEEEHSHATSHLLLPEDPGLLGSEGPLVLVDDEFSTGRTILNTIAALHRRFPRDHYVVVALVDMRSPEDRAHLDAFAADLGARVDLVAAAAGSVHLPEDVLERGARLVAAHEAAAAGAGGADAGDVGGGDAAEADGGGTTGPTAASAGASPVASAGVSAASSAGACAASSEGVPSVASAGASSVASAGASAASSAGVSPASSAGASTVPPAASAAAAGAASSAGAVSGAGSAVARVDLGWPEGLPDGGRHGFTPAHRARLEAALPAMAARVADALAKAPDHPAPPAGATPQLRGDAPAGATGGHEPCPAALADGTPAVPGGLTVPDGTAAPAEADAPPATAATATAATATAARETAARETAARETAARQTAGARAGETGGRAAGPAAVPSRPAAPGQSDDPGTPAGQGGGAHAASPVRPLPSCPYRRVLVLGFEELMYAPLRIAQALDEVLDGVEVRYSTTTRSPVLAVDDPGYAIRTRLTFPAHDEPADGPGPRYAYNVAPGADPGRRFDAVVAVVDSVADTPALHAPDGLLAALGAQTDRLLLAVVPSYRPQDRRAAAVAPATPAAPTTPAAPGTLLAPAATPAASLTPATPATPRTSRTAPERQAQPMHRPPHEPSHEPSHGPLRGPEFSSYAPDEVGWLLQDFSHVTLEAPTEEREEAIQSGGAHYAESLPVEYQPSERYQELYRAALDASAARIARAVGAVTETVLAERSPRPVLVSLARAGTPVGVLMRRWARHAHGLDLPHYAVSIVRGRGIDTAALRWLADHHDPSDVVFVDGWTGKGAITRELSDALAPYPDFDPRIAVLADPGRCVDTYGTRDDFLVPSACLNSTVSGLISRTVLRADLVGPNDFHGAKYYRELAGSDVSGDFLDTVSARFAEVAEDAVADAKRLAATDRTPTWEGWAAVERISREYGIHDVNLVKPGVGETTRVLLRRVPWKILAQRGAGPDLDHVRLLAEQRGVPVEETEGLPYTCVGLIHPRYTRGATGADGKAVGKANRTDRDERTVATG